MRHPATTSPSVAVHDADCASYVTRKEERGKRWNWGDLATRLTFDAASAAIAAGLVAPIVTVVDRAVAERVSGRTTFVGSLCGSLRCLILRPHTFVFARPARLMMLLYSSTYLTANTIDTISSAAQDQPPSTTTSGLVKFGAVSLVNLSLALYKDSQFAKMFGIISPRPLPPASYALLALRDTFTIFASFNLPPKVAPMLPESVESHISCLSVAQFATPALAQIFNTPLHLLGLDLYNRNCTTPVRDRLKKVRLDWLATSLARMCRVIPAFGIGGVVNHKVRASTMNKYDRTRTAIIDRSL